MSAGTGVAGLLGKLPEVLLFMALAGGASLGVEPRSSERRTAPILNSRNTLP